MGAWTWLAARLGRKGVSKKQLQIQLVALDQRQAGIKRRVTQAESDRQQLYVRGIKSSDDREKLECARRVRELEADLRNYDVLMADLERQKTSVSVLVRALEAKEVAPDRVEMVRLQGEVERLTTEVRLSQQRLDEVHEAEISLESSRLESAPEESVEVRKILATMRTPGVSPEDLPRVERES